MMIFLVLLHFYALVYAATEADNSKSSEIEENSESKRSIDTPPHEDLCESGDINEECKMCELLNAPQGGTCCSDPDSLLWCHLAIQELINEVDDERNEDDENGYGESNEGEEDEGSEGSSEEDDIEKRYGSLFTHWQWYNLWNEHNQGNNVQESKRSMGKRYGHLFGSLFSDRKLNKIKRYGMVFGRLFTKDRNKRYGNLMGRLFGRYSEDKRDGGLRKRYGSLFRPLFSSASKDKRYGSLFRPLFAGNQHYGSRLRPINSAPKPIEEKRNAEINAEMVKRYGSLFGKPYSSKKLGR